MRREARASELHKKQYRKFVERETPEEYQERRKLANEHAKRKRMNETQEQRQRRLERDRRNRKIRSQKMTPEELEARRQRNNERRKKMKEKQRQQAREQDRGDIPQPDGSQNAEASETATKRPGRRAKCKAGSYIRRQLEQKTPEVLVVSDESMDALDVRNSFNESDDKVSDSNAVTDQTTKSNGKESECSMTLAKKWGLRPLVVRLERIDVAETSSV